LMQQNEQAYFLRVQLFVYYVIVHVFSI
jgi:hypothetical protein